jgi:hypothetical protein
MESGVHISFPSSHHSQHSSPHSWSILAFDHLSHYNNNSTMYRLTHGYSKTLPEKTYGPKGTCCTIFILGSTLLRIHFDHSSTSPSITCCTLYVLRWTSLWSLVGLSLRTEILLCSLLHLLYSHRFIHTVWLFALVHACNNFSSSSNLAILSCTQNTCVAGSNCWIAWARDVVACMHAAQCTRIPYNLQTPYRLYICRISNVCKL